MVITCPTCGHQGKVDPSRIPSQGAKAKCPKCQNGFMISGAPPQQPAVSAPPPVSPSQANSQPTASKAPPPQTPEPVAQTQQAQPQEPPLPEPESQPPAQGDIRTVPGFCGGKPGASRGWRVEPEGSLPGSSCLQRCGMYGVPEAVQGRGGFSGR